MSSSSDQASESAGIRETYHGFFTRGDDPEDLADTHECTLFVTDMELVIGDQGEYQPAGGLLEMVPEPLVGIATKLLGDDDVTSISHEKAIERSGTAQIDLTEIATIEVEKGMPPLGKQLVEIELGHHGEWTVYIGTADSYGGKEQTRAFVETLETAAHDAGGAPKVRTEYDL